jgi:hypothetical protein
MAERGAEIAAWGTALGRDADILIYGCDVGAGATGHDFVTSLASLTGADVAASDDLTGSSDLGGDWVLETRAGLVETAPFATHGVEQAWLGVLLTTGEVRVNQTTSGAQSLASQNRGSGQAIGMASDGSFVVVWTSVGQDGDQGGVYARLFNADGTPKADEFRVNTTTAGTQEWAVVDVRPSGEFVVAWTSRNQASAVSGYDVYYKRFDAAGVGQSGEVRANKTISGDQSTPAVAWLDVGGLVVAWQGEGPGDSAGIFFRRFTATDNAVENADQLVNTLSGATELDPSVAALSGGGFVVFFESGSNHMYHRRYDAAGAALDASQRQVDNTFSTSSGAAVDSDSAGNYIAVYREEQTLSGVWGRGYTSAGAELHPWFYAGYGSAASPDLSIAPDGAYLVTYQNTGDGDATGIYARKYNSNGSTLASTYPVNLTTMGAQAMPAIAVLDANRYAIAWSGNGPGDSDGIFVRVFDDTALVLPVITSNGGSDTATVTVPEGSSTVTTVMAVPADGSTSLTFTYSLNGGADQDRFQIDPATGVLSFVTPPDYEAPTDVGADNVYDVFVEATSSLGGLDLQELSVTVQPVNDNVPVIISDGGGDSAVFSVPENRTLATTVMATDADLPPQTLTYSIVGGVDQGKFQIEATSGALSFKQAPDYEAPTDADANNIYLVTVQASDGQGGSDSQSMQITITSVNEPPVNAVPGTQATPVNTPLELSAANGNGISISDPDAAGGQVLISLSTTQGLITLNWPANSAVASGGEFLINTTTTDRQASIDGEFYGSTTGDFGAPRSVATSPDGFTVATWSSKNQDGDGWGIYAQRYDASGAALGGPFRINTTTAKDQVHASVEIGRAHV